MMTTERNRMHLGECVLMVALACIAPSRAKAQTPPPKLASTSATGDLTQMSIEDLMNLEVTSGAKKQEPVQHTAAAIFVITSEDIRRSGANNIPDMLRMVPGLDVAQISGSTWSVSSRGFGGAASDKMLVLIDGRTVYSPFFSGVVWDAQDILLSDIERIEVIRGPGAALWGSNAVNGVINITTKSSTATQGTTIVAAGGNVEGGYGAAQYGGQLGDKGFFRVFAKGFSKTSVADVLNQDSQDGWNLQHGGFRADWKLNSRDSLTVQGDIFRSVGEGTTNINMSLAPLVFGVFPGELKSSGGDVLARWRRKFSARSELSLQTYFDQEASNTNFVDGKTYTFDIELQHRIAIGERHDVVWGVGYRGIVVDTSGSVAVSFIPPRTTENLASAFIQDEIELAPGVLRLTLGGRVERAYGGKFNFQPDARLLWTPSTKQAVWLAASRAYRDLSPTDTNIVTTSVPIPGPGGLLLVPEVSGNPNMRSEAEIALQAGYRVEITSSVSMDGTTFFNRYTNLRGQDAGTPIFEPGGGGTPYLLLPETFNNKISGQTHGIEFSGTWKPRSIWKLSGGYTWLDGLFHDDSTNAAPNTTASTLNSPHHQFSVRSSLDLPHHLELDGALYRVGALDTFDVPGYYRLDLRLGWHVGEHAEFAVVGQNLLSANHLESPTAADWFAAASVRRSYYAKITWHFQGSAKK